MCHVMFVFVNLNNHDVISCIQEQVGPSSGASTFNLTVTCPDFMLELCYQEGCHSGLLRLVIADDGLILEQMDKAT